MIWHASDSTGWKNCNVVFFSKLGGEWNYSKSFRCCYPCSENVRCRKRWCSASFSGKLDDPVCRPKIKVVRVLLACSVAVPNLFSSNQYILNMELKKKKYCAIVMQNPIQKKTFCQFR